MPMLALISPFVCDEWHKNDFQSREGLGLRYISAYLIKENMPHNLIDADAYRLSCNSVCEIIIKNNYAILGISCVSQRSYKYVKELVYNLRDVYNYKGYIFLGGFFVSLAFEEILEDINGLDFIIVGEGEKSVTEVYKRISQHKAFEDIPGVIIKKGLGEYSITPPYYETQLDDLPFPIRDLGIFENQSPDNITMRILGGRGCYGHCTFCSVMMHDRPRYKVYRSALNVVEEIDYIYHKYHINKFAFNDEIFYDKSPKGRKWVADFCSLVDERMLKIDFQIQMRATDITEIELSLLKKVGLHSVSVGYESGVQRILDEMNKYTMVEENRRAYSIIKKTGLNVLTSYIMIVPTMNFEELKENFKFLLEIGGKANQYFYNRLNIYYGCAYEKILERENLLIHRKKFYDRHNYLFKDKKVELYANFADEMKKKLIPIRIKLYNFINKLNDYNERQKIINSYTELNDDLIVKLLGEAIKILDTLETPDETFGIDILNKFENDIQYFVDSLE